MTNTPAAGFNYQTLQQASHGGDDDNELTLVENTLYGTTETQPVKQGHYQDPADVSSLYSKVVKSNDLTLIENDLYE